MTTAELIGQVLGPSGALVLAVIALRHQTRAASREQETLRRRYEQEIDHLRQELDHEQREHQATGGALREEHRARLEDARRTTATLLQLTDRIHTTVDGIRELCESVAPGPLPPPTATTGTSPRA